jgi:hypothetical protein
MKRAGKGHGPTVKNKGFFRNVPGNRAKKACGKGIPQGKRGMGPALKRNSKEGIMPTEYARAPLCRCAAEEERREKEYS